MKNNRTFKMNGKVYASMMEIARELGLKRVYPRDFAKLGIEEITADKVVEEKQVVVEVETAEDQKVEEKTEKSVKAVRRTGTDDQIKEAVDSVGKLNVVEFNNLIKHFTLEALIKMAEAAEVNTWETIENEPIRKMRLFMEIKSHYYPNEKTPVKSASGWKKLELSELLKIADENKVAYKKYSNEKIQRMWLVVALNEAGINCQDYTDKKSEGVAND